MITNMLIGVVGNPLILGILGLVFFLAIYAFMRLDITAGLVFLFPALLVISQAVPILNPLVYLALLFGGLLFGIVLLKLIRR
jgi:hypothetical protein